MPFQRCFLRTLLPVAGGALLFLSQPAVYAEVGGGPESRGGDAPLAAMDRNELEARRLLRTGKRYLEDSEFDKGVRALENLLEQYPESEVRFEVHLELGRHFHENVAEHQAAIDWLKRNRSLLQREEIDNDLEQVMLESQYLLGVSYYYLGDYDQLFTALRKIVTRYPNSIWANQAYYYIGMAHFTQKNWPKAIEYLSLVGTFVDPDAPTARFVEAGRRFYCKVQDGDLPIITKLSDKPGTVEVTSQSGDTETITLMPLSNREALYIGSISTKVQPPSPQDGKLQVIGGDRVKVRYLDGNTEAGDKDVPREAEVQVVSTGTVAFVKGTLIEFAKAAFTGQDLWVNVKDVDLDRSDGAETVRVRVESRYISEQTMGEEVDLDADDAESADADDPWAALAEAENQGPQWVVRDEVTLTLEEVVIDEDTGEIIDSDVVRSGDFIGAVPVVAFNASAEVNKADAVLTAAKNDELVAYYTDEMHVGGDYARESSVKLEVVGEFKPELQTPGGDSGDEMINARKLLTEGQAFLELARIFKSMGLADMGDARVEEGLSRADEVIQLDAISPELRQRAFKLRWELHLAKGDLESAIATLTTFNEFFPESDFADDALMSIAEVHRGREEYSEAIAVYNKVLGLENSELKPQAQFSVGECLELQHDPELEPAIPAYRKVAEHYGDSMYAGEALAKLVAYHTETDDYVQATDLLEQIFIDHPDEPWLDGMLLRWAILSYKMGNYSKALEKCQQLLIQYPESEYTKKARKIMPRIRAKLDETGAE